MTGSGVELLELLVKHILVVMLQQEILLMDDLG
jgi:hypothetical protein